MPCHIEGRERQCKRRKDCERSGKSFLVSFRARSSVGENSCLSRRRSRVRVRRSRHFRIADLSCQRCSLEILCSCRPQRQVATADSSLKPSRLPITNRGKLAFRSLRDEALTKFGEFIGAGREFPSVIRSTLCAKESSE